MAELETHSGSCDCGGVSYRVSGPLRGVIACHCSQCRKTSGHHAAMTSAPSANFELVNSDELRWYNSSGSAQRGFCGRCGGNVFWKQVGRDAISITAGTLDPPTGLAIEEHIFVADKSDYYDIEPGAAQKPRW
jgi:hypothetical protein